MAQDAIRLRRSLRSPALEASLQVHIAGESTGPASTLLANPSIQKGPALEAIVQSVAAASGTQAASAHVAGKSTGPASALLVNPSIQKARNSYLRGRRKITAVAFVDSMDAALRKACFAVLDHHEADGVAPGALGAKNQGKRQRLATVVSEPK